MSRIEEVPLTLVLESKRLGGGVNVVEEHAGQI